MGECRATVGMRLVGPDCVRAVVHRDSALSGAPDRALPRATRRTPEDPTRSGALQHMDPTRSYPESLSHSMESPRAPVRGPLDQADG